MPLLLSVDPIQGGYEYVGSSLHPWHEPGLGMFTNAERSSIVSIE